MKIKFKATLRKHDSGYARIEKSGDLDFDKMGSDDGVLLYLKDGGRVIIDCDFKTKVFSVKVDDTSLIH